MSNKPMIKPDDVLRHLCNVLPLVTDKFSDFVAVTSAHIDANLKLVLTMAHGDKFKVGRGYGIKSLVLKNPIESCNAIGNGLHEITTAQISRVTENSNTGGIRQVEIDGWGWCDVVAANSARKITVRYQGDAVCGGFLLEYLSTELSAAVCEGVSGNRVTFGLSSGYWYECDCLCDAAVASVNIIITATPERAVEIYTSNYESTAKNLWCFLIFGDRATVSKANNAAGIVMQGQGMTQVDSITVGTDFDLLVFFPRRGAQESARAQINEAYGEIYEAFEACLFGYSGITGYHFAPRASGIAKSQTLANYIHQYSWQAINERKTDVHGIAPKLLYWDVPIREVDVGFLIDAGDTPQDMRLQVGLYEDGQ